MQGLKNKIAVVTSSTRGIGLACAKRLAEEEAHVYLAIRKIEAGQAIAAKLSQKGQKCGVVYFDAEKEETYASMMAEVAKIEGRVDILVNNYGSTDVQSDFDLLAGDTDRYFEIVNRNLKSVYLPSKEAVRLMMQTGGGSIVNISSVGGMLPDMSRIAYGTAKAAINFLTKNIAVQYAAQKIRCNAVMPGLTETEAAMQNMPVPFLRAFLQNVPLGRIGQPEDIASAVAFLASDEAAYITGETIPVAGGFGLPSPLYAFYPGMMKDS